MYIKRIKNMHKKKNKINKIKSVFYTIFPPTPKKKKPVKVKPNLQ